MTEASKLKILVIRDGEEKANMTFPIYTLRHVHTLMPENVLKKLEDKNINLKQLIDEIHETGLTPQTVFEMSETNKSYRVWIE